MLTAFYPGPLQVRDAQSHTADLFLRALCRHNPYLSVLRWRSDWHNFHSWWLCSHCRGGLGWGSWKNTRWQTWQWWGTEPPCHRGRGLPRSYPRLQELAARKHWGNHYGRNCWPWLHSRWKGLWVHTRRKNRQRKQNYKFESTILLNKKLWTGSS